MCDTPEKSAQSLVPLGLAGCWECEYICDSICDTPLIQKGRDKIENVLHFL